MIVAIDTLSLLGKEGWWSWSYTLHLFLLRISSPLLGKGRGGGHGETQPSAEKRSSFPWIGEV